MRKSIKWLIPIILVTGIVMYFFSSSVMGKVTTHLVQAYADKGLYKDAIEKANLDQEVISAVGKIKPIDKMTILNGEVIFSDDNNTVHSTIKVIGEKGAGKLDITAKRENENWQYEKINLRFKDPLENRKIIEIIEVPYNE